MSNQVPIGEVLSWMPRGQVSLEFLRHPAPVSCEMGPFGSGKTTNCFLKLLLCSMAVPRSPVDGRRYARSAVVRDTYKNLEINTIQSWEERFPRDMGDWKGGSGGEPARALLDFKLGDGSDLHWEVLFTALGDHNVKQFCDGLQVNNVFFNGLDALPREVLMYMGPRVGRWPPPQHRPADWIDHRWKWRKIVADMNAPDLDNWTYLDFVEKQRQNYALFIQPGGMDDGAENLENVGGRAYYEEMLAQNPDWWVNRFVHNKFGYSRAGTPVYPEYDDARHVAKAPIAFDTSRPLLLAFDAGRDACMIVGQRGFEGDLKRLAEFVPEERMSAKAFGRAASEFLALEFPDAKKISAWADPAAANPNDIDDMVWIEIVSSIMGIDIKPAPSNDLTPRLEAVRAGFRESRSDGKPMASIDPKRCPRLRKAYASGYRYGKEKRGGDEISTEVPVKNQHSHIANADEYLALGSSDYRALRGRGEGRRKTTVEAFGHAHDV